jgi:hypothetical protein
VMSPTELRLWVGPAESRVDGILDVRLRSAGGKGDVAEIAAVGPLDPSRERLVAGVVQPRKRNGQDGIPEMYRLNGAPFKYEIEPDRVVGGIIRAKVRFPSPLETEYPVNNTVYGEYYRPFGTGPFPCVIVLHITGGDFELSRFISRVLAKSHTAALFIKMPYYGERRPKGERIRMVSNDLERGLRSMRQVVLDLRRTADWIEARPELDGGRIGVMGVSLGAIAGALSTAIEPRISHACLVLGGAHLENVLYESVEREAREYRKIWIKHGGTRKSFAKVFAPYDPGSYAERLHRRVVLMISASHDRTIPKESSLALWEATGRQRILWYPCGHYSMAKYFIPALGHATQFFRDWPDRAENGLPAD